VWKLEQQGEGIEKGHEIRMEVEAEGLYGLWASVEYIRMPGRGDDGRRGRRPRGEAGAMKTRHCAECRHLDVKINQKSVCARGHKPKFFMAKTMWQAINCDYGYKRKCADYEAKR
jgi:hypothetical protein